MMRVRLGPKTIYIATHPRDVQHVLQENARNYHTLSIVCITLFGHDISQEADGVREAHSLCLQHAEKQILALIPVPESIPTPANRRYARAVGLIREVIDRLIDERRAAGEDRGDLLSTLAFARYEETGELMEHEQLRAEIITLLLNGHETVSDALGWAFYICSPSTRTLPRNCTRNWRRCSVGARQPWTISET
jgi:hypothetical protein